MNKSIQKSKPKAPEEDDEVLSKRWKNLETFVQMKKDPRLKSLAFTYAESLKKAGPNSKHIVKIEDIHDTEDTRLNQDLVDDVESDLQKSESAENHSEKEENNDADGSDDKPAHHSPIVQPKIVAETEEHTFDSEYSLE